jgi:hypothetical protein
MKLTNQWVKPFHSSIFPGGINLQESSSSVQLALAEFRNCEVVTQFFSVSMPPRNRNVSMLRSSRKYFSSVFNARLAPLLPSQSAHPEPRYLGKTPFIACGDRVILRDRGCADHEIAFPRRNAPLARSTQSEACTLATVRSKATTGSCPIRPSTKAWRRWRCAAVLARCTPCNSSEGVTADIATSSSG